MYLTAYRTAFCQDVYKRQVSSSIVGILYNIQLMRMIGESGVAAYSVMMYVDFVFVATFIGFSIGTAPIVSYQYGAGNTKELKNIFRKNLFVIGAASVLMVLLSECLSYPLSYAFVGYSPQLLDMTVHGFRLFALSYFCCGINIYASSFFTALCNGLISAVLAFMQMCIRDSLYTAWYGYIPAVRKAPAPAALPTQSAPQDGPLSPGILYPFASVLWFECPALLP